MLTAAYIPRILVGEGQLLGYVLAVIVQRQGRIPAGSEVPDMMDSLASLAFLSVPFLLAFPFEKLMYRVWR